MCTDWRIRQIIRALDQGALIAYPTDTIWGLGCHPLRSSAIERLLRLKRRSFAKGLILLSSQIDYLLPYINQRVDISPMIQPMPDQKRPTTWIVPARDHCPGWLTGHRDSIAIRITDKPLIKSLCDGLRQPLVSTSANFSGRPPARNRLCIRRQFGQLLDYILEDHVQHSRLNASAIPSMIRDLQSGKIIRA